MSDTAEHAARERALLGAALTYTTLLDRVTVDPADFTDPRHANLWHLLTAMREKGRPTDPGTVLGHLTRIPTEDRTGIDGPYLHDLYRVAPTTINGGELAARDVTSNAAVRRLQSAGIRITQLAEAGGDALDIQELARQEIDAACHAPAGAVQAVGDTIDATLEELDNPSPAIPTPWAGLNYFLRGWRPGNLVTVGARPGVGKSILLLQAAVGLAAHGWVAFSSLEMTRDELNARLIAQTADVPLGRLQGRTDDPATHLTDRDWDKIATARPALGNLRLAVDARPEVTVADIRAHARAVARRGPLAAVIVDYLQLIEPPRHLGARSRAEVVGHFSRKLKILAKELDVPVLAAVQLNRGPENRADKQPTMADIRESGAVEQDSDVVLLMHMADQQAPDLDVIVAKQRQGPQGVAQLDRQGEFARITARQWRPHFTPPPAYPAYADN